MKVRMSAAQPGHTTRPKRQHKVQQLSQLLTELSKKVDGMYNKDKNLPKLEASLQSAEGFMQLDTSSVEAATGLAAARRAYVVAHGDQLQDFAQVLAEVS